MIKAELEVRTGTQKLPNISIFWDNTQETIKSPNNYAWLNIT